MILILPREFFRNIAIECTLSNICCNVGEGTSGRHTFIVILTFSDRPRSAAILGQRSEDQRSSVARRKVVYWNRHKIHNGTVLCESCCSHSQIQNDQTDHVIHVAYIGSLSKTTDLCSIDMALTDFRYCLFQFNNVMELGSAYELLKSLVDNVQAGQMVPNGASVSEKPGEKISGTIVARDLMSTTLSSNPLAPLRVDDAFNPISELARQGYVAAYNLLKVERFGKKWVTIPTGIQNLKVH